jgi:hypothetical protein
MTRRCRACATRRATTVSQRNGDTRLYRLSVQARGAGDAVQARTDLRDHVEQVRQRGASLGEELQHIHVRDVLCEDRMTALKRTGTVRTQGLEQGYLRCADAGAPCGRRGSAGRQDATSPLGPWRSARWWRRWPAMSAHGLADHACARTAARNSKKRRLGFPNRSRICPKSAVAGTFAGSGVLRPL